MGKFRKKPWRTYSRQSGVSKTSQYIRYLCCGILVLELAFFVRDLADGGELFRIISTLETAAGDEAGDLKIYGIRLRLDDGEIDFYKKETLKSTD